jgi:hypothetical protein
MVYRLKTEDINQSSLNVHSGGAGRSFGVQAYQNPPCTLYRQPVRLAPFCPHVGQIENEASLRWH